MTQFVSRDPFARQSIVKRVYERLTMKGVQSRNGGCHECGNYGKDHGDYVLWQFGTDHDTRSLYWHPHGFCSKRCHDTYNGLRCRP